MTTNEREFRASQAALCAGRTDEFLAHWVEDGRYEVAYPMAGFPAVVEGREQLAAVFAGFGAMATTMAIEDVHFHQTRDDDLAFVEQRWVAELVDGSRYENRMVLRVRFCGGRIAEIFEYYGEKAHEDLITRMVAAASVPAGTGLGG